MSDIPLSYAQIRTIPIDREFRNGPWQPIDDYRVAAGLLFVPFNDNRRKKLVRDPLYQHPWVIQVISQHDFLDDEWVEIEVTPEVVEQLKAERLVSGTPKWGYTDEKELQLNGTGKRRVVTEWFSDEMTTFDALAAGASYNTLTHELSWR